MKTCIPWTLLTSIVLVVLPLELTVHRKSLGDDLLKARDASKYRTLVNALGNKNQKPSTVKTAQGTLPVFSSDYDWAEQRRVVDAIAKLTDEIDSSFAVLVDALEDDRYCVTAWNDGTTINHTVGGICSILVRETLAGAFSDSGAFEHPALRRSLNKELLPAGRADLKEWCKSQLAEGRLPYEIQIARGTQATKVVMSTDAVSNDVSAQLASVIDSRISMIRSSKKVIGVNRVFNSDSRVLFSQERAEEIRRKHGR